MMMRSQAPFDLHEVLLIKGAKFPTPFSHFFGQKQINVQVFSKICILLRDTYYEVNCTAGTLKVLTSGNITCEVVDRHCQRAGSPLSPCRVGSMTSNAPLYNFADK